MKKVHGSKKTRQPPFRITIRPLCSYCRSVRWRFYSCHDDRGIYLAVACGKCEAQGPAIRPPIGHDRDADITNEVRREAADAWSSVWDQIAGAPDWEVFYLDEGGNEVDAPKPVRRRRPAKAKLTATRAPAAIAPEHQVHHLAPKHNGHGTNGHNGSVL